MKTHREYLYESYEYLGERWNCIEMEQQKRL